MNCGRGTKKHRLSGEATCQGVKGLTLFFSRYANWIYSPSPPPIFLFLGTRNNTHHWKSTAERGCFLGHSGLDPNRPQHRPNQLLLFCYDHALALSHLHIHCPERHVWSGLQVHRTTRPRCHAVSLQDLSFSGLCGSHTQIVCV